MPQTRRVSDKTFSIAEAMDFARRRHQAGALNEARGFYGLVLESEPNNTDAMTLLASVLYRTGEDAHADALLEKAIDLYRAAHKERAADIVPLAGLVNLLLARGRTSEAELFSQSLNLPVLPVRASEQEFIARREAAIRSRLPLIVVTTLPKSASESIWNHLAEGLQGAQCHLSVGLFPDCCLIPSRVDFGAPGGIVAKEHITATDHNLATLAEFGINRIVVNLRDPRQVVLSWVHFVREDISQRLLAPIWRKIVPPSRIFDEPLETQIDWALDSFLPLLIDFARGWVEADRNPQRSINVLFLTFEQFRADPVSYANKVVDFYDLPRERFAHAAEFEVVHLRKGMTDEWRSIFTPEQQARAWDQIPTDLAEAMGWTR